MTETKPVPKRPKRGDRFVHAVFLKKDARPLYGAGSYAVHVVTATRKWGNVPGEFPVDHTSACRWDAGHRNSTWYFDWSTRNLSVREWL